jgi:hypothetical protein
MKPVMQAVVVLAAFVGGMMANDSYRNKQTVRKVDASIADTMAKLQELQEYVLDIEAGKCMNVTVFCAENVGVHRIPKPKLADNISPN